MPITYATWNPSDKGGAISLSGGNLIATKGSQGSSPSVRSTISKTSGKWFWEITITSLTAASFSVGSGTSAASITVIPGSDVNSWGYLSSGSAGNAGNFNAYGATFTTGDVIGVALDMDGGTLTFYKNGVSQGQAFSGVASGEFAMIGWTALGTGVMTANFGASAFAFSVPTGYNSGLYSGSLTPPVADFSGTPTSGNNPLAVTFTDLSTNTPTSWSWDFGDGNTSTSQNPTHTYANAGTYTVKLTATNADGSDTKTRSNYITVTAPVVPTTGGGGMSPEYEKQARLYEDDENVLSLIKEFVENEGFRHA